MEQEIEIRVKYVSGTTIAYVTYTYEATTLPNTQQTTSTVVGEYNNTTDPNNPYFDNKVILKSGTTYKMSFSIFGK